MEENENPKIFKLVKEICKKSDVPVPKIAISEIQAPNAFVFGRTSKSSTLVLTKGLLEILDENEIKAVIGHEIGHIKHKDMIVMTLVGVIPMLAYLLSRSFIVMKQHLRDEGVLVTYYAHISPDAWISLLEAGWKNGKFSVINAFPMATESLQRVTARGKYALDTSIIVVWKRGVSGSYSADELYHEAIKRARQAALDLIKVGRVGSDLFVGTMAAVLNVFTRYENLYSSTGLLDIKTLVTDYVYPATAKALAMAFGEFAGILGEIKRPESLFYLITKTLFPKPKHAKRKMDRTSTALLSIGTKADIDLLQKLQIVRKEKEIFYLGEPATAEKKSFDDLLEKKDINPAKPIIQTSVDALHLLEYYSITLPLNSFLTKFSQLKEEYSSEVEEAINIAAILAKVLPSTDPEKKACEEIIARIKGEKLA